jgi:hypothetical protein
MHPLGVGHHDQLPAYGHRSHGEGQQEGGDGCYAEDGKAALDFCQSSPPAPCG